MRRDGLRAVWNIQLDHQREVKVKKAGFEGNDETRGPPLDNRSLHLLPERDSVVAG